MASLSTCHLGLWLGWQILLNLVSVDGCSSFPDPDGFFDVPDSLIGFLVYNFHSLPVYDVVFSCRMVCKGGFIGGRHQSFFPLLVYFSVFVFTSFLCSSSRMFSSLPVSPMYSAPQFLHGIWYTSSPCSSSSLCPWDVPTSAMGWCGDAWLLLLHISSVLGVLSLRPPLRCTMTSFSVIGTDEVSSCSVKGALYLYEYQLCRSLHLPPPSVYE